MGLGIAYAGAQDNNGKVAQAIADALMDRSVLELGQPLSRLLVLALGLIYLEKQKCLLKRKVWRPLWMSQNFFRKR